MADELIDIYDDDMNLIGQAMRSQAHNEGLWHKIFKCWIVRQTVDGDYVWFQLRGKDKDVQPNMLDSTVAGHILAGETAKDAIRESEEEIGLKIDKNKLNKLFTVKNIERTGNIYNREFDVTYLYETDVNIDSLIMQPDEVDGVFEAKVKDVDNLLKNKTKAITVKGLVRNNDNSYTREERVVGLDNMAHSHKDIFAKAFEAMVRYFEHS